MQFSEFTGSAEARRRYWARSYQGWRRIGQAQPNAGHRALAGLESLGLRGVITQNVDGLHQAAGSRGVINLHGDIARVVCLDCECLSSRLAMQRRLAELNPDLPRAGRGWSTPNSGPTVTRWSRSGTTSCWPTAPSVVAD